MTKSLPVIFLCLLLVACGGTSSLTNPNNPNNPNPPVTGACAVTVTEDISVNSIMEDTTAACDYLIADTIIVTNGTLTIEPGVVTRFAQDTRLHISDNARLIAVGTADKPIRFEAQAAIKGYAYGLYFSSPLESRLEHVDLINLGKEDVGLWANHDAAIDGGLDAGLALKNVSVSGSIFQGADLRNINLTAFENNQFFDNAFYGLIIDAAQAHMLDKGSDYIANGQPYVLLDGVGSNAEFYETANWKALNAPYFIDNAVWIQAGTLTLEPGIRFIMGAGTSFDVKETAALIARGTALQPIVFTGEQKQAGYWDSLSFFESDSRSNWLDYVEVRYGGGSSLIEGAVSVGLNSYLKMTNSVVADSGSWGVCVTYIAAKYAAIFEASDNTYINNPLGNVVEDCD